MHRFIKGLFTIVFGLALITSNLVPAAAAGQSVKAKITLQQKHKTFKTKQIKTTTKTNLMKVLKKNFKVKEKQGMITDIAGHSQNKKASSYWLFKVNGKMASKGATQTYLKNHDSVTFNLAPTN
ncbi:MULTISPECIES: DUF4430 domain-containing protein [Loigolactobacillus]|uniref:Uncharacterized protein n=1 Tax=Loigolactobacillus backii TaxID=375175 RepID=A0A192H003_9LACO|nr:MULTISPECIES: DUF4430 domain-containing protein [Loigolactobacillus]ANK60820.1 hypothetical protein AYR52_11495 [Loigolactobacillus backii]ANK61608.1 hypothetical protein AYR53_01820 [Loigolactobacillus backii]ANK65774.1 hypothetical protein AYR54_11290 [Loigolactobacillus backii]ANK68250.1 hypothetical protein AYR55_11440 [Loigolactobacillus backii]ANK69192.1 hypothetical protein AYR56_02890 [Loigolactobacillus backii]